MIVTINTANLVRNAHVTRTGLWSLFFLYSEAHTHVSQYVGFGGLRAVKRRLRVAGNSALASRTASTTLMVVSVSQYYGN